MVFTHWYLDDGDLANGIEQVLTEYSSSDGKIEIQGDWLGKTLFYSFSFEDDLSFVEESWDGISENGIFEVGIIRENEPNIPDILGPELLDLSLRQISYVDNDLILLEYEIYDESGLNSVSISFRDELGNTHWADDNSRDGVAALELDNGSPGGQYFLDSIRLYDTSSIVTTLTIAGTALFMAR